MSTQIVRRAKEVVTTPRTDGQIDAVVVRIDNTGDSGAPAADRYLHLIEHNLGRNPVGCAIMWTDKDVRVYVVSQDENRISVRFTDGGATVNLEIW